MNNNKVRHAVLKDIILINISNNLDFTTPVKYSTLLNQSLYSESQVSKTVQFLISGSYLNYSEITNERAISLSKSGLAAFNSEYFFEKYVDEQRITNNNRWMICTNAIVALGVVYSIFHENFNCAGKDTNKSQSKVEQKIPAINHASQDTTAPLCNGKNGASKVK